MQHMVLLLCKQVSGQVLLKHDLLVITVQNFTCYYNLKY